LFGVAGRGCRRRSRARRLRSSRRSPGASPGRAPRTRAGSGGAPAPPCAVPATVRRRAARLEQARAPVSWIARAMARETIDELLTTGEPLALPGVYDGISGILAAHAGFRAVFLAGYSLAATRLGRPDLGLLTQTEVIDAAGRLIAAVDVPVIVD